MTEITDDETCHQPVEGRLLPVHRPASGLERSRDERGMTTAEYAVGTVAACGFAGVLLKVLTDDQVQAALLKFVLWLIGFLTKRGPF